jgi:hypothetical protein
MNYPLSTIHYTLNKDIGFWDGPLPVQVGEGLLNMSKKRSLVIAKFLNSIH